MNKNIKMNEYKESFESLIVEFKEKRENVISILKIIIDQKKVIVIIIISQKNLKNSFLRKKTITRIR